MSGRLKAVAFDYGNVLAFHDRLEICARLARHSPLSAGEVLEAVYGGDIERDSECGRYDSREHFLRIKKRIHGETDWSYEQFCEEYRASFLPNPEAIEAMVAASATCRVFVLSNTTFLHAQWMFSHEVIATIPELYILSFKVGVMKPDPEIWRIMLRRGAIEAHECLYIDDVPEFSAAARKLGFPTITYRKDDRNLVMEVMRRINEGAVVRSSG